MAIAYVQSAQNRGATSAAAVFGSNNASGNLLTVGILLESTSATVSTVTDTRGNVWASATTLLLDNGNFGRVQIWYAKNCAAGANTVTVTPSSGIAVNALVAEYSGADTSSPLDVISGAIGPGATMDTGSATTTAAGDLIFGLFDSNFTPTASGSSTQREVLVFNAYTSIQDKIAGVAGSYSSVATLPGAGNWASQMATFKPAGIATSGLRINSSLSGLGSSGPFFHDRLA